MTSINTNIIQYEWPKIDVPLVTVSRFLIEKLRFYGKTNFLIENESKISYTFDDVCDDSLRMANVLKNNGLKEGQNFGICGYNNYEFIVTLFGGLIAGGVAVLIDGNTSIDEMRKIIKEREIKCMTITTRDQKSLSNKALNHLNRALKTIVTFNDVNEEINNNETEDYYESKEYLKYRKHITSHKIANESQIGIIKSENTKNKNCLILQTSGSYQSTKPKLCRITDYNLISQLSICTLPVTGFNWNQRDIVANTTSFCHISGIIQLFASLTSGSQLVIFPNNSNLNIYVYAKAIEKLKITASMLNPNIIISLIKEDLNFNLKSLKKVICSGSSMPKNMSKKFIDKYSIDDFRQAYGMTELCGFVTMEPIGSKQYETVGVPLPLAQIKIIDTDSDVILKAGQIGEVCVRSPQVFNGYMTCDEDLGKDQIDSEGWFHTSDIGYYDSNRKLQIVDPIKDFIVFNGLHISPTSLEAILSSHFAVKEAVIFGNNDSIEGQMPTALVVLKSNQVNDNKMVEELTVYMNDLLKKQNLTLCGGLFIVEEIPKTICGKFNRTVLKNIVNQTIRELNNNNKYYIINDDFD